jgi:hypothetical protein
MNPKTSSLTTFECFIFKKDIWFSPNYKPLSATNFIKYFQYCYPDKKIHITPQNAWTRLEAKYKEGNTDMTKQAFVCTKTKIILQKDC